MSPAGGTGSRAQVGRLLAMLPYLQARPGVRVAEVAAAFAVSESQVVADLRVLWFCGLPGLSMGDLIEVDMDAVEGQGTVTVTNADYLARPLRLDAAEATALVVAVRALRESVAGPDRDAVNRVLGKLSALVDAGAGRGGLRSRGSSGAGAGGPGGAGGGGAAERPGAAGGGSAGGDGAVPLEVDLEPAADAAVLDTVTGALARRRRLHLVYAGGASDELTERDVDPRQLVSAGGRTYLDAWCHRAEGNRLFLLTRIRSAAVLDVPATPPPAPDDRSGPDAVFRPAPDDPLVTLRTTARARWVSEYHPVESVRELPDGGQLVRMRIADTRFLRRLALRLGADGQVLDPPELAADIRAAAAAALAAYGAEPDAGPDAGDSGDTGSGAATVTP